ncbi:hypothetical protein H9P43_007537 [Blastocladiella emersonii ATCC 22665]|nr:hypothetical protein H9P43_007537 [Blastocladiella emersonii ATCC 22665]
MIAVCPIPVGATIFTMPKPSLDEKPAEKAPAPGRVAELTDSPIKTKLLVVLCAAMIGFASHFAGVSFSALKTPLKKELKLTNTQIALTQSSDNILQTILPLAAGFLFDFYGTGWGSLVTTVLVTIGNVGVAAGVTFNSFGLLAGGRVVYGAGAGAVNVIQQLIISKWFSGKELATAMAALLTVNRLGSSIGQWVLGSATPNRPFWFGSWITVAVSVGSILFNIAYVLVLKRTERFVLSTDQKAEAKKRKAFTPKALFHFQGLFWILSCVHLLSSGLMNSYLGISPDFLTQRDKKDLVSANYKSVISLAVTAAVYPFMGPFVDRFGHRLSFSLLSNALLIFFFVAMNWTHMDSTFLMVLFAFTIPFKALASLVAIPILVPDAWLGTAFAVYKCLNAVATATFDNLVGVLQDGSKKKDSYFGVMVMFTAIAVAAFVINVVWWWVDRTKYDGLLQKNNKEREGFMAAKKADEDQAAAAGDNMTGGKLKLTRAGPAVLFVLALLGTWIFYIVLAVNNANAPEPAPKAGKKLLF